MQTLRNRSLAAKKDLWTLDTASSSVYFEYLDNRTRYQLWYDDEVSLAAKYRACRALGSRGVAMWTAGSLEYGAVPAGQRRTAQMWRALREFTANNGTLSAERSSNSRNATHAGAKLKVDDHEASPLLCDCSSVPACGVDVARPASPRERRLGRTTASLRDVQLKSDDDDDGPPASNGARRRSREGKAAPLPHISGLSRYRVPLDGDDASRLG